MLMESTVANVSKEENYIELKNAGKQLVSKRNDLIQKIRYSCDLLPNKLMLYMFSKIQPDDKPGKIYEFKVSELSTILGYKKARFDTIKNIIAKMNAICFWRDAEDEDQNDELIALLNPDAVEANRKRGFVRIQFSNKIFPYIMELNKQKAEDGIFYTSYELQYVILMNHTYSMRLYELLLSYSRNNRTWKFEVGTGTKNDLFRRIASVDKKTGEPIIPKGWIANFNTFERDVLRVAKEDINKYTDLMIDYETSKYDFQKNKNRKVSSVTFVMMKKTKNELEETRDMIDQKYKEMQGISKKDVYKQTTIEDFIRNREEQVREEKVESSDYPVLTDSFIDCFTEKQIDALGSAGLQHIDTAKVESVDYDMWLTDYVTHYKIILDSTSEKTKTTPFQRLMNMIKKDYDGYSSELNEKYNIVTVDTYKEIKMPAANNPINNNGKKSLEEYLEAFANIEKSEK